MSSQAYLPIIGGTIDDFMHHIWQKKPLCVRQAIPHYQPLISLETLQELAKTLPTRWIDESKAGRVQHHLPKKFPPKNKKWTFLVQQVNTQSLVIADFMQCFAFMGYTQLDDVMISYATTGAGIGAHVDTYDVFLFQGMGQRTWHIARSFDPELIANIDLKILKNFTPEQSFTLNAGDLLYLPAGWAHQGIAESEGMTYSVGFRAPNAYEMALEHHMQHANFLMQHEDNAAIQHLKTKLYAHDGLRHDASQVAKIPQTLVEFVEQSLRELPQMSASYSIGCYLSTPTLDLAALINEDDDEDKCTLSKFKRQKVYSVRLGYVLLYDDAYFYLDGQAYAKSLFGKMTVLLEALANQKKLAQIEIKKILFSDEAETSLKNFWEILYQWYEDGYIELV